MRNTEEEHTGYKRPREWLSLAASSRRACDASGWEKEEDFDDETKGKESVKNRRMAARRDG
jgi:hypothetical protein